MSPSQKILKVGLMCNDTSLQQWQYEALEKLLSFDQVELSLVILKEDSVPKKGLFQKWLSYPYALAIFRIHKRFFQPFKTHRKIDFKETWKKIPSLSCTTEKIGKYAEYFNVEDLKIIGSYELDFIIRFGFNILKGEILTLPKYGVWSYHHSDEQLFRGGPPCLWEIYRGKPTAGVILQRLTEKIDSGVLLKKGWTKTQLHSLKETTEALFESSADFLRQAAVDILHGNGEYFTNDPITTKAPMNRYPKNMTMFIFLLKLWRNKLRFHYQQLYKAEIWKLGIVNQTIEDVFQEGIKKEIQWIETDDVNTYYADGFGFNENKIITEYYDYRKGVGILKMFEVSGENINEIDCNLTSNSHLAFPYTFEHDGETYCVPETAEQNKIVLYRWDKAQRKWEETSVLIEGIQTVDNSLVHHNGKWWLFCTMAGESNHALYIFYADELMSEYKPHTQNPVKIDVASARPAGHMFHVDDKLYRPSQDCSTVYGRQIKINNVKQLSENQFIEETFQIIESPENKNQFSGIHTISRLGNKTLIDQKQMIFISVNFWLHLKRKIKKVFS